MADDSLANAQQSLGDSDITYPLWPPLTRGCPETSTDDIQYPFEIIYEQRSLKMTAESDTDEDLLTTYFEQTHITICDRGEPPLANAEDSLLDRDRIHLTDDE